MNRLALVITFAFLLSHLPCHAQTDAADSSIGSAPSLSQRPITPSLADNSDSRDIVRRIKALREKLKSYRDPKAESEAPASEVPLILNVKVPKTADLVEKITALERRNDVQVVILYQEAMPQANPEPGALFQGGSSSTTPAANPPAITAAISPAVTPAITPAISPAIRATTLTATPTATSAGSPSTSLSPSMAQKRPGQAVTSEGEHQKRWKKLIERYSLPRQQRFPQIARSN